jgi:signal transduction histidine kinase
MSGSGRIGAINLGWPALAARLCVCLLVWIVVLSGSASGTLKGETRRVTILHSFGRDFRPWGQYARTIREELDQRSPWQLDIQEHSLITARSSDGDSEAAFVDYLNAFSSGQAPDIVISIGAPAANFIQRNRVRLFTATPMVLTAVEQRRIQFSNLSDKDTVVAVAHDFPRSFETILRVLPGTKRIVVINGASPNEKFWLGELRKEAALLGDKVEFVWHDDLSFQDILKKSASLPPATAIFWHLMNVDATGVVYEGDAALRQLYAVSNAPIFSYDDGFFGKEVVGGPMHSVLDLSSLTVAVAIRILGGEKPSEVRPQAVGYAHPKFDWREIQRWGISESNLPAGSQVLFREPGIWARYSWQISLVAGVILIQGALIGGLLHERRRRRLAEVESRQRLAELAHVNRYSAAGELTTSIAHELNQPLGAILTNTETAELMLKGSSPNLDEVGEILADIRRDDQRASEMIRRLRSMLKRVPFEVRDTDLNDTVREVIGFLTTLTESRGIALKYTPAATELPIRGDVVQLQQVVLNLIMNAMDAISGTQAIKREIGVTTSRSGAYAEIRISDTGPGIAAGDLKNVFDRFFTTKPHGMGMGLAIVRTIVEAHQGQISAENQSSGGALFTIRLPIARGRSTSA